MINKFKKYQNSKLVHNGIWLYILQIFNTIVPLISIPYITRVLGASQFGVFSFSLNIIGYLKVIVDYGFDLSGSRQVAVAKDEKEISRIFNSITKTKLLLFMIAIICLFGISFSNGINEKHFYIMLILITMVLGSTIQQTWLFQGLQVMKYITIPSVISRLISLILIFALINESNQVYLYTFLFSITFLLNGLFSLFVVRFRLKIKWGKTKRSEIIKELQEGWHIFTTSFMTKIFTGVGITVLGFTTSDKIIGVYSAIQKIPLMLLMIYAPVGQVIYPYISKCYKESFKNGLYKVLRIMKILMPFVILTSIIIIVFSHQIIYLLFGKEYALYSNLVIPLVIWATISILNNFLGIQVLVASGYQKEYSQAFRIGVIATLCFNFIFGYYIGVNGIALAALLSELVLTIGITINIRKIIKYKVNF